MHQEPIESQAKSGGSGRPTAARRRSLPQSSAQPVSRIPGRKRVLLTNAYGPYELHWGTAPSDLLGARLARGDELFRRSSHLPTWALYLLAENLSHPCTVLEFPRWQQFMDALDEGYDVVAIELKSIHTRRVVEMMRAIRQASPGTEIVIGGYGVGALRDGMPGDSDDLAGYILNEADFICRGEGVRAMREYLHDAPYDRPITQYQLPPARVRPYQGQSPVEIKLPAILVSMGCPSACDFCNTSAFFHHKKITIASPDQVYQTMKHHQRVLGEDRLTFILFDEDIFLDPAFVRELGRLIRSDRRTWGFRWISFGSIRALEAFSARELREHGVEGIWIGVESSLVEHETEKLGYAKRGARDPLQLFAELRQYGIETIGSMILGLDFHTPENIEEDIDYFVRLKPTFYQIGPIRPCPGTALYRRMRRQGRLTPEYNWEHFHLWEETSHKPRHFEQGAIRKYYDLAHERLRTRLGSPILQIYEVNLLAYEALRHASSEFLRFQAQVSLDQVRRLEPVVRGLEGNPTSPVVLARTRELLARAEHNLRGDALAAKAWRRMAGGVVRWRMGRPAKSRAETSSYAPDPICLQFEGTTHGEPTQPPSLELSMGTQLMRLISAVRNAAI